MLEIKLGPCISNKLTDHNMFSFLKQFPTEHMRINSAELLKSNILLHNSRQIACKWFMIDE